MRFSERKGAEKAIFSGNCLHRSVWEQGVVPNRKYKEALSLLADGNPDNLIQGYEQLIALNGFKDSEAKAAEVFD